MSATIVDPNNIISSSNGSSPNREIVSPLPSGHLETGTRFWQFKVEEGLITYVRYGNIRPDGNLMERAIHIQQHSSYLDAKKFVENIVDEKIKAGYVGNISSFIF
ncbi:23430_t:CDS:2 [Cetraspora pellucida]|uniref:23430_t:CDS:1 n=1 Tax=Cetraspora pellucida TaxID=1433469 RepID=A0A9N9D9I9_9GLOM|nr:23430_t:CDS:2 [Cetraspora pellucida]